MHRSAVQSTSVQCSAVQYGAVQYIAMQWCALHCSAVQCSTAQFSAVKWNTVNWTKLAVGCGWNQFTKSANFPLLYTINWLNQLYHWHSLLLLPCHEEHFLYYLKFFVCLLGLSMFKFQIISAMYLFSLTQDFFIFGYCNWFFKKRT